MNSNDERKTANTKLKNLIQPIFVKKSYLYLGTPPLIKMRRAISMINLPAITKAAVEVVFSKNSGSILENQVVKECCIRCRNSNTPQYVN